MAIFLLRPRTPLSRNWEEYVPLSRMVVRAADEREARQLAAREGPVRSRMALADFQLAEPDRLNPWLDPDCARCDSIAAEGEAMVLSAQLHESLEATL